MQEVCCWVCEGLKLDILLRYYSRVTKSRVGGLIVDWGLGLKLGRVDRPCRESGDLMGDEDEDEAAITITIIIVLHRV